MNKPTGIARAAVSVLVVGLVAIGIPLLVAGPASAHTPSFSKNCHELTVSGSTTSRRTRTCSASRSTTGTGR